MSPGKDNFSQFSHSQFTQPRLSGHEFLMRREIRFVITHFTFHNLRNKLCFHTHSSPSEGHRAHDENIKKIARKIQIHNAKRYVLLDKTFCAKKCVQYLLFITLQCFVRIFFAQPSATFSTAVALDIASYMITFYYYCCRASTHNF